MSEEQQTRETREYVVLKKCLVAEAKPSEEAMDFSTPIEVFVPIVDQEGKVRRFVGTDDDDAIDQYCGNPVVIPGTYKAIAWRYYGGSKTKRPTTITETITNDDE